MAREPDLTIDAAAAELSISRSKLYELLRMGEVASYYIGRARRIRRDSLDAYRDEQTAKTPKQQPLPPRPFIRTTPKRRAS